MAKSFDSSDVRNVEAMIRAAGTYVRASDELRPRVLEAARLQSRERRAQRLIQVAAMLVLPLALIGAAVREKMHESNKRPLGIVVAAGFDEFFVPTAVAANRGGDGDWRMLDAFTELRRQQAEVLQSAL